jgi:hypothetical protein
VEIGQLGLFFGQQFVERGDLPGVGFGRQQLSVMGDVCLEDEISHGSLPLVEPKFHLCWDLGTQNSQSNVGYRT